MNAVSSIVKHFVLFWASFGVVGCSSQPKIPSERVAASEAAIAAAERSGAASPDNALARQHLQAAREELQRARVEMNEGKSRRAELTLIRSLVDAELAQACVSESNARRQAEKARTELKKLEASEPGSSETSGGSSSVAPTFDAPGSRVGFAGALGETSSSTNPGAEDRSEGAPSDTEWGSDAVGDAEEAETSG